MSKSKNRQHEPEFDLMEALPVPEPLIEEESVPKELQHEPIITRETLTKTTLNISKPTAIASGPFSSVIRYECYEHPEQGTEIVVIEGQRKRIPVCPNCGYSMIEVIERKKFQRG